MAAHDPQAIEQATNRLGVRLSPARRPADRRILQRWHDCTGSRPIRAHLEQSDRARIDRNAWFQTHIDSRFDAFGVNLVNSLHCRWCCPGTFQESLDEIASEVASVKADVAEQIPHTQPSRTGAYAARAADRGVCRARKISATKPRIIDSADLNTKYQDIRSDYRGTKSNRGVDR